MKVKWTASVLLAFGAAILLIQPALGRDFPTKPIELLCPYAAGGSLDIVSRLVADLAPKYLGQPMVVVNKLGAGGSVAAGDVISSKPDGYKMVMLANIFFATTVKMQKVPFDPNLLTPIANLYEYKLGLVTRTDSPWKTLPELLDYAKKNPGKLRVAYGPRGISLHLNGLLIFKKAGAEVIEVFYKGGTPEQLPALLGGHVDVSASPYGSTKEQVLAGKMKYLVVFSDRRYSDMPGVPTAGELGFPEAAKLLTVNGLYAHRDTPESIRKTLFDALKKISEDPEFRKGIETMGDEARFGGPDFVREAIRQAEEVGVPILKDLGLYVGK